MSARKRHAMGATRARERSRTSTVDARSTKWKLKPTRLNCKFEPQVKNCNAMLVPCMNECNAFNRNITTRKAKQISRLPWLMHESTHAWMMQCLLRRRGQGFEFRLERLQDITPREKNGGLLVKGRSRNAIAIVPPDLRFLSHAFGQLGRDPPLRRHGSGQEAQQLRGAQGTSNARAWRRAGHDARSGGNSYNNMAHVLPQCLSAVAKRL